MHSVTTFSICLSCSVNKSIFSSYILLQNYLQHLITVSVQMILKLLLITYLSLNELNFEPTWQFDGDASDCRVFARVLVEDNKKMAIT